MKINKIEDRLHEFSMKINEALNTLIIKYTPK